MDDTTSHRLITMEEYTSLREEILKRAEFQQSTVHLAIIIAGALLSVFFQF